MLVFCRRAMVCFLCYVRPDKYYVCNPSINIFKMLPQCNDLNMEPSDIVGHVKMAFDPTKSPHYKVVHAAIISDDDFVSSIQIPTYSSRHAIGVVLFAAIQFPCHPFYILKMAYIGTMSFETRGCLLLLGMDGTRSRRLNIYEMRSASSIGKEA
ncbi:hypothetical protein Tco_1172983 [Tanacetum coccineum]